jgi:hypothetical protein
MKSVVQAAWLLTVAFGNLIVILVAEGKSDALSKVKSLIIIVIIKNFKLILYLNVFRQENFSCLVP